MPGERRRPGRRRYRRTSSSRRCLPSRVARATVIQYSTVLYPGINFIQYSTVLYRIYIQYCTVHYRVYIQYCTVGTSTVLYSTLTRYIYLFIDSNTDGSLTVLSATVRVQYSSPGPGGENIINMHIIKYARENCSTSSPCAYHMLSLYLLLLFMSAVVVDYVQ